ncbi:hypothetical protein [Variovorax sp. dw_308]|uniref:hypothetical protein n=1 Tax=Variovorax sp. dw_308 TaxID=2721546 RepID=UPI001C441EF4|nr:hypothetical protein [Variovorax sp. dw_308]
MPSPGSPDPAAARGAPPMPPGAFGQPGATAPPPDAVLCEHAIETIWRCLDAHDLVDEHVRAELVTVLEPLAALPLGPLPQRLIDALKLPNPVDASRLYWLTRRLLTVVPVLQEAETAFERPAKRPPAPLA